MNLHRPLRSSGKIWLAISIPLFIACWFIFPVPIEMLLAFITGDYICPVYSILFGLVAFTVIFGAAAMLAGWILQFFVCMTLDHFHKGRPTNEISANQKSSA
jgi:hypothetical protein